MKTPIKWEQVENLYRLAKKELEELQSSNNYYFQIYKFKGGIAYPDTIQEHKVPSKWTFEGSGAHFQGKDDNTCDFPYFIDEKGKLFEII